MKITEAEVQSLLDCRDRDEWDIAARRIKTERGNSYPSNWGAVVLASGGVMDQLEQRWGQPGALQCSAVTGKSWGDVLDQCDPKAKA